jgi:uncharacterized protein YggE
MKTIIDTSSWKCNKNLWKYATISLVICLLLLAISRPNLGKAATVNAATGDLAENVASERTITVTGSADVMVAPDEVNITVGVETRNSNFQQAKSENDKISAKIIDLTRKYGIEQKYVQSDYIRTYPSYQYDKYNETSRISYYVVQKRIVIKLKDISKFEQLLSDISDNGGAMIQNIEFLSTELSKYRNEARKLAVQAAKDKAKLIAQEAGSDIGKAITINEEQIKNYTWYNSWWGSAWYGGYDQLSLVSNVAVNYYQGPQDSLGSEEMATISIGQIKITARIGIVFELK